jgi:hypothetical protein
MVSTAGSLNREGTYSALYFVSTVLFEIPLGHEDLLLFSASDLCVRMETW